jgi:orotate phosphoribosyltransferase
VVVVEDVTTTGGSALKAVAALRAAGAVVEHVVTVVDREEGARDAFAAERVSLHALFRKSEFARETAEWP